MTVITVDTDEATTDVTVADAAAIVDVIAPAESHVVDLGQLGGPPGPPGPPGPTGPPGQWVAMTLTEYEALPVKDPDTLYVIVS